MHAVGMMPLIPLLAAVSMISGAFGFFSAVVLRRRRRRPRRAFALGFLCGAAAAAIYDVRRRGVAAFATAYRRRGVPSRSLRRLSPAMLMSSAGKQRGHRRQRV
jgi:hypothetical protein